jgi:glucose-1-phosphate cytidylyltransferase
VSFAEPPHGGAGAEGARRCAASGKHPAMPDATADTSEAPPVVILCGGRGTRLRERTAEIPKALVEIGGQPILWHVVRLHAAQGLHRFVLCTGYRGEMIAEFVAAAEWPQSLEIECLDTGIETPTGGRVKLAVDRLSGGRINLAYADGLADVDLRGLLNHHRAHSGIATMVVVRPRSQFGVAELDPDGRVRGFSEKPRLDHWVNGGFFCLEPEVLEYLDRSSVLEREPMSSLADDGQLHAYRHEGFWDCMDTYKDAIDLNDLWARGEAPWAVWESGDPDAAPRDQGPSPMGDSGTTGALDAQTPA